MKLPSIRKTTIAISLAGLLPIFCVLVVSGGLKKGAFDENVFALFGTLFLFSPSIVLAYLGYRKTNSRVLPIILLVSSILSTGMWMILACAFMSADKVDAQAGMAVVVYFLVQLFIVVLATLSFLLVRKK